MNGLSTTKIKDILLTEIKNDLCDFMQKEVKQKIYLNNQEEYQTALDKKLITNLEKGLSFSNQKLPLKMK